MSLDIALSLVNKLNQSGYRAYLVGGCVRDMLLCRQPHDFDIASSATPQQVKSALSGCADFVDTGLEHGTVTVLYKGTPYEVTTFRSESGYSDHRRPDRVEFLPSIEGDLARRDFTINAIAMSVDGSIIDPFGGKADLENRVVRCVGNPHARFDEDPLRILRAVRFYSVLGFPPEPETARAIIVKAPLLCEISRERVRDELSALLLGEYLLNALLNYRAVIFTVLPELAPLDGFDQKNPWHIYELYEHSARVAAAIRPELNLRLAALLHDTAKPACFSLSPEGKGRFHSHASKSALLAEAALKRLRFSNKTVETVETLIKHHSDAIPLTDFSVKRRMSRLGIDIFMMLTELMIADDLAKNPAKIAQPLAEARELQAVAKRIAESEPCLSVGDLKINGDDIISLGVEQGAKVGCILNLLLESVLEEAVPNQREQLISAAREIIKSQA